MSKKTAIVILAAGASSRLGQPKQLLSFGNNTFIERLAAEALSAGLGPVLVVTGAAGNQVEYLLHQMAVQTVFNNHWQEGMGSSIVCGIRKVMNEHQDCDSVILAVCDQPYVSAAVFSGLQEQRLASGKGIIASAYAGTIGTPVLFTTHYFDSLLSLSGELGAKSLISSHGTDLATIDFQQGEFDIDRPEDYKQLLQTTEKYD